MKNKNYLVPFVFLTFSIIACTISVNTLTGNTVPGDGGTIPTVTETGMPPLPPPAMAILEVAYIKGDNVWIWKDGSAGHQITSAGSATNPVISGDGTLVAFTRNGELWVVGADGTNEHALVDTAYLGTLATSPSESILVDKVVWQPGTHVILFTTLSVLTDGPGYQQPRWDLNSTSADSSTPMVVNFKAADSGGIPYPSPNGNYIALAQPDKVIIMEASGANYTVALTFPNILTYSEWAFVPALTWLPGSDAVRLVVPAADPLSDASAPSQFWNVPVSGSPTVLASFVTTPAFAGPTYISPDGQNVAYLQENSGEVYVHSINASAVDTYYVWYASGSVGLLGWTPDSIHFMIWTPTPQIPNYISVGTLMGMVDTPTGTDIQWVDSTRFLFLSGNELRLKTMDSSSTIVDSGVTEYSHGISIVD